MSLAKPSKSFLALNINFIGSPSLPNSPPIVFNLAANSIAPSGLKTFSATPAIPSISNLSLVAALAILDNALTPPLNTNLCDFCKADCNDFVAAAPLTPISAAMFIVSSTKSLLVSTLAPKLSIADAISIANPSPSPVPSANSAIA